MRCCWGMQHRWWEIPGCPELNAFGFVDDFAADDFSGWYCMWIWGLCYRDIIRYHARLKWFWQWRTVIFPKSVFQNIFFPNSGFPKRKSSSASSEEYSIPASSGQQAAKTILPSKTTACSRALTWQVMWRIGKPFQRVLSQRVEFLFHELMIAISFNLVIAISGKCTRVHEKPDRQAIGSWARQV